MKVLFDHQIFHYQYGGASKYFAMLLKHLPREAWATTARLSSNEYVRAAGLFPTCRRMFRGQTVMAEWLNRPLTHLALHRGHYDVFHQTNFSVSDLRAAGAKPMVTTFHDTNLSTFDPHPFIVERQRISLERADAIVCVSRNTAQDMLSLFSVEEKKVHVIYHGIEQPDLSALPSERLCAHPYILYVGRRSEYKNFTRFLEAFAAVHSQHPSLHVVCTGAPFSRSELTAFEKRGLLQVMHCLYASEADMLRLYRDAELFVFPSLYEGFGMPILEAWSCHCPVVLSQASCFPEIAADAAEYFEARNAEAMAHTICRVLESPSLRQDLIVRGDHRVAAFSWQRCAEEHMKVYESLI